MLKPLARLVAFTIIIGLLLPGSLLAHSNMSSQSLASQLAVSCTDSDPNYPAAEGLLVLNPDESLLTLLIDFNDFNNPVGSPLPGDTPLPITNGVLDMSCEDSYYNYFNFHADFAGPVATYGWDFEANFPNIFSPDGSDPDPYGPIPAPYDPSFEPYGPGLKSCVNPRVNISFQRDEFFTYNCVVGLLLPAKGSGTPTPPW